MADSEGGAGPGLGTHLRALRRARGLTLVQVAEASGLSHPFLSQVERGLANMSLASLRRVALALETSPVELVAAAEHGEGHLAGPIEFTRAGEGSAPSAGFAQGTARALASGARPFLPLVVDSDEETALTTFVHAEDEFMYVVAGRICVELDGNVTGLNVGDSAYYAGGTMHRWWSADGGPCQVLVVKQQVGT